MSAQKQCPKCGEKNPAEAVMCWACYTSLSGGVAAPVGGAGGVAAATMTDSGEKKKIEPKQLAIIGIGLVVVLGFGVHTMMGSSSGGDDSGDLGGGVMAPSSKMPSNPPATSSSEPAPAAVVASSGSNPATPANVAAAPSIPYNMISSPNPRFAAATAAIVPTQNDVKMGEAKGLAIFAHHQLDKIRKFESVEIFVFNNPTAAQTFANYQSRQRGAPMQVSDYQSPDLTSVWSQAMVRYNSVKGRVTWSYPQLNPTFWKTTTNG